MSKPIGFKDPGGIKTALQKVAKKDGHFNISRIMIDIITEDPRIKAAMVADKRKSATSLQK